MRSWQVQLFATSAQRVRWRVLSANNREIARAVADHRDPDSCRAAVRALQHGLDRVDLRVRRIGPSEWLWEAADADVVLVRSAHGFGRLIRCEQALQQFADNVAGAVVAEAVLEAETRRFPGVRSVRPARSIRSVDLVSPAVPVNGVLS